MSWRRRKLAVCAGVGALLAVGAGAALAGGAGASTAGSKAVTLGPAPLGIDQLHYGGGSTADEYD